MQRMQEESVLRTLGGPRFRRARRSALIIAGAAGKGPYAAGALTHIASDSRFDVSIVVGASSGAMNAAVYAAGLRVGRASEAADLLCKLWKEEASFPSAYPWKKRKAFVKDGIARFQHMETVCSVQVRVVVTSLLGVRDKDYGYVRAEETHGFDSEQLTNDGEIDRLAELCVASAAIPILFAPRKVREGGPYWDGGLVDNTPLGWALKKDPEIDHVIVVTPDTTTIPQRRYGRLSVIRLLEIVIEERLSRDLHEARDFNAEIQKLVKLGVTPSQLKATLGWRVLEFVEVRPREELSGNLLSGFFRPKRRAEYIEAGRRAAADAFENFFVAASDAARVV